MNLVNFRTCHSIIVSYKRRCVIANLTAVFFVVLIEVIYSSEKPTGCLEQKLQLRKKDLFQLVFEIVKC